VKEEGDKEIFSFAEGVRRAGLGQVVGWRWAAGRVRVAGRRGEEGRKGPGGERGFRGVFCFLFLLLLFFPKLISTL
jgi:hypothetical protein